MSSGTDRNSLSFSFLTVMLVAAVAWRLENAQTQLAPNLELLTSVGVLAAVMSRTALVPIAAVGLGVFVSDLVLGVGAIQAFTWSAWIVSAIAFGWLAKRRGDSNRFISFGTLLGLGSSVWFFLWTNFGVWILQAGKAYSPGLDGLAASLVAGLPFFRTMILGNLICVPLVLAIYASVRRAAEISERTFVRGDPIESPSISYNPPPAPVKWSARTA